MKKSIKDLKNLEGKTVLMRADFNVPLKNGVITNDNRIVAALETIKYILGKKSKISNIFTPWKNKRRKR